jgi:hypothetical protein
MKSCSSYDDDGSDLDLDLKLTSLPMPRSRASKPLAPSPRDRELCSAKLQDWHWPAVQKKMEMEMKMSKQPPAAAKKMLLASGHGSSPKLSESTMATAVCPKCLMYVLLKKSSPSCPKCFSPIPLPPSPAIHIAKRRRLLDNLVGPALSLSTTSSS